MMQISKGTFFAALIATMATALETKSTDEGTIKDAYFKFVAMFGKSYGSIDHMQERYDIFKDNFLKIESHNNSVDD